MRHVSYVLYLRDEHLELLICGYVEQHCLLIDGDVWIKMVRCI